MKKKENPKTKNRWYVCILYKEDPKFLEYYKNILTKYYYVTYIDHDKDTLEDGTLKKEHRHIIFNVGENARHVGAIADEIGIPSNYLERLQERKNVAVLSTHKLSNKGVI